MDHTVGMQSVQLSRPTDKPAITKRFVQKGEGVANIPNTGQAIQVRGIDYAKKATNCYNRAYKKDKCIANIPNFCKSSRIWLW